MVSRMGDTKESQASLADQIEKALEDDAPDLGPVSVRLQIEGPGGLYEGQTVDITPSGALIRIADGKLVSAAQSRNLASFNRKVSKEFSSGMRIRLAGNGVFHEAGLVRVVEPEEKRDALMIACDFYTPLSPDECRRLGVDPEARADALKEILEAEIPPDQEPFADDPETEELPIVIEGDKDSSIRERRKAPRVDRVLYADVEGDFDAYKALVMNVSFNGALLTLTDPSFVPPTERDKLVLFTRRLGVQFGNGLVLRLLEPDISVQSDVVRVSERQSGTSHIVVIGCRFRRNLTPPECQRLGIDPPPADSADEAVLAVANPYFRQTRIRDLMVQAMKAGATDLHVKVYSLPRMRQGGILFNMDKDLVRPEEAHAMALELMSHEQAARFERDGDVELAYTIDDVGRFRVNVLRQRGLTGLAIRCIPGDVPTLDSLKL
ncbi:MAG: PilZ domain-containing protein, partial [Planctomycetota bacterium]